MRRLLIVPIVHSRSDLGSLANSVSHAKSQRLGATRSGTVNRTVEQFWHELTTTLTNMTLDYHQLLLYQDGLPVIENSALQLERTIVEDLARNGSPNHRLVKWFMEQGACLVGTESAQLLLQEYAAIRKSLAAGFPEPQPQLPSAAASLTTDGQSEVPLICQRDRYIASRISGTLGDCQVGLLFIGMLHRVEDYLPADIAVEYPIGRPNFDTSTLLDSHAS